MTETSVAGREIAVGAVADRAGVGSSAAARSSMGKTLELLSSRRVAPGTMPVQPPQRQSTARRFGAAVLLVGLAALGAAAVYRLHRKAAVRTVPHRAEEPQHVAAARHLNGAAAMLSFSVLADSAMEHYRGAFHNPAMYLAPTVSAITLANSLHMAATPAHFGSSADDAGADLRWPPGSAALAFHTYNLAKREGGINLSNLFYGAPLGAPLAITLAGLAGLGASRLVLEGERHQPGRLLGLTAGPFYRAGDGRRTDRHERGSRLAAFSRRFPRPVYVPARDAAAIDRNVFDACRWQSRFRSRLPNGCCRRPRQWVLRAPDFMRTGSAGIWAAFIIGAKTCLMGRHCPHRHRLPELRSPDWARFDCWKNADERNLSSPLPGIRCSGQVGFTVVE